MYFLDRKERYSMSNILGNCSMPVNTWRWKGIAICEDVEPLEEVLSNMTYEQRKQYRIISNEDSKYMLN